MSKPKQNRNSQRGDTDISKTDVEPADTVEITTDQDTPINADEIAARSNGEPVGQTTDAPEPTLEAEPADGTETDTERGPAQTLSSAFMDERDDVLAVINELEDQLDHYEEIREGLERDLTTATRENQAGKQRVQELEWQIATLETRLQALEQTRHEISLLEEELSDAGARNQRLTEQSTQFEKDNKRLTSDLNAANAQIEELWAIRKERDNLRSEHKALIAKLDETERTAQAVTEERDTLQGRLQEATLTLEETSRQKQQLEMELRIAEDRNEEVTRVRNNQEQKIDAIRRENKNLQAQLTHVEREQKRLLEQQQFYECELNSLRNMNRSAESALTNVKRAFGEVRAALSETKTRARRRAIESWPRSTTNLRQGVQTRDTDDASTIDAITRAVIATTTQDPAGRILRPKATETVTDIAGS